MPPDLLRLDIFVPLLMYCALMWWVGRRLSWRAWLATVAATLVLIAFVVLVERGWR